MNLIIYFIIGIITASGLYIWFAWDISSDVRRDFVDTGTMLIMFFCIFAWPVVAPTMIMLFLLSFLIKGLNYLIDKYIKK